MAKSPTNSGSQNNQDPTLFVKGIDCSTFFNALDACLTCPDFHVCNLSIRAQSERFGTKIFSETVNKIDLSRRPFKVWTSKKAVEADTVIIATGDRLMHDHH